MRKTWKQGIEYARMNVNLRLRTCLVLFAALALAQPAEGSSTLVRQDSKTSPITGATVKTYSGEMPAAVSLIEPSSAITILLASDTLSSAELTTIKKDLLALYPILHTRKLRLAILRDGQLLLAGPFTGPARFRATLNEIRPPAASASGGTPAVALTLIDSIYANAEQLGADWSSLLVIGNFPALDPAVAQYASGLLFRGLVSRHIRTFCFSPVPPESLAALLRSTGGGLLREGMQELPPLLDEVHQVFYQIDWSTPPPPEGFVLAESAITLSGDDKVIEAVELAAPADAVLPPMALYQQMRSRTAEGSALLGQDELKDEDAQRLREGLKFSLGVNPLDPETLTLAARMYERFKDYAEAANYFASLAEVRPREGAAFAALGHDYRLAANPDKAEAALLHALELGTRTPLVAEDLARVHLARNDDRGALPFLAESLQGDSQQGRQDLWFLQADAAKRVKEETLAIHSFEAGLALGGSHVPECGNLINLYVATQQNAKATALAKQTLAALPADPVLRAQFATVLDDAKLDAEALSGWRRVLEVQPQSERAHQRVARLLLQSGDNLAALQAAEEGLAALPSSAPLFLVKSDAELKLGQVYGARNTLKEGAAVSQDPELLAAVAASEDIFGAQAASAYDHLAAALPASSAEQQKAWGRGFAVAIRDGDLKQAETFASALQAAGRPEMHELLGATVQSDSRTMVLGGLDALAFVVHANEHIPPERFFLEYSRAILNFMDNHNDAASAKEKRAFIDSVEQYFQRLASLEAMGQRQGEEFTLTLGLGGKQARAATERALSLVGVTLRSGKGGIELAMSESKGQAQKQVTASALALDIVGMQEAFRAGKSYTIEVPYEGASIYPNEKFWRDALNAREAGNVSLPLQLLRYPNLARVYVGMNSMDRASITQLLSAIDLKTLVDHYSDLFHEFAPAFAVQKNGHAAVPGGIAAEAIWAHMAQASPEKPGTFFRALLEHNDGKLLAFFYTLAHLDRAHQAFFTANPARADQCFQLFVETRDRQYASATSSHQHGAAMMVRDSTFSDFLRSVPLDRNGHVDFPGSAAVWMVAKGQSSGEAQISKLAKAQNRYAGTEVEDSILTRLASVRYHTQTEHHSELDNFLAVAHINAHRSTPLDPEAALILAQHFSDFSAEYPYFSDITGAAAADYRQYFDALAHLRSLPWQQANLRIGELSSLVEWICLLRRHQAIDDSQAAGLFRLASSRFLSASTAQAFTTAAVESALSILAYCKTGTSADARFRECVLGADDASGIRARDFARVLDLQKAPALEAVFAIYRGGVSALKGGAALDFNALDKAVAALPRVGLPEKSGFAGKEKDLILHFGVAEVEKAAADLKQKATARKPKPLDKSADELLAALEPQVALALSGPVYAYYTRPTDLVVAEDPLLLRKHRYVDFAESKDDRLNLVSEFEASGQGSGSHFSGGFAAFAEAAGQAAGASWKTAGRGASETIAAQIAAIRSAAWERLNDSDQRLLALRIQAAREWMFEAARQPEAWKSLAEDTLGVLSLSRRADLLNGIESRNWRQVWSATTLPDLYVLGEKLTNRYTSPPWPSPLMTALFSAASSNDGARLRTLGPVALHSLGCGHPHLFADAPYEEYEWRFFPTENAERWAEFKIYLVFEADSLGISPRQLSTIAEPLAARAFRNAQTADHRDWRALTAAYVSVTAQDMRKALEPQ